MWWTRKERDKKRTLVFNTKRGIRRSRPQNMPNERVDPDRCGEEVTERSESMILRDKM